MGSLHQDDTNGNCGNEAPERTQAHGRRKRPQSLPCADAIGVARWYVAVVEQRRLAVGCVCEKSRVWARVFTWCRCYGLRRRQYGVADATRPGVRSATVRV